MRRFAGHFIRTLLIASAGLLPLTPAAAEDYPIRPVRAITPLSAGGISDIFMRSMGEGLQKIWGQPIVVDNRPGGGMNIGGRACAEAAPDGYTICIVPAEVLSYNQFMFKKPLFDPAKDFVTVTNLFFVPQVLVASSSLNVKTLDELVALSKAKPGTLSYTVPSVPLILYLDTLTKERGADMVRVPFKGGADAVNGILTGTTPVAFLGLGNVISYIEAGTMTPLAIDSDTRWPLLPDVPTLRELGYKGKLTRVYFGLVAPAGTPPAIVAKIAADMESVAAVPVFRDRQMIARGLDPIFDGPDKFARFLTSEWPVAEQIVKESGLPLR